MNSKPAHSVDRPSADEEVIEQLGGEDPARFLYLCGEYSITYTVQSLLDGMVDSKRIELWLQVEDEVFGARRGPMKALAKAQARINSPDDRDIDVDVDVGVENDSSTVDEDDRHDQGDDVGDEEPSSEPVAVQDADFEERVQNALSIASEFSPSEATEKLQEERDRDEPRDHVLEALQRRLDELGSEVPNADTDSGTEVSA